MLVTKRLGTTLVVLALITIGTASAAAGSRHGSPAASNPVPPISWGVADDASKFADDGGAWFDQQLASANLTENRWTLAWDPADPTAIEQLPFLERAAPVAQEAGIHVVLALYSADAKQHDPVAFCSWAQTVAETAAQWGIHDYIVWNEPNTLLYWSPQKNAAGRDVAAAAYERLLATCYDTIHAGDPDATVIGMGLSPRASTRRSNDPLSFLRDVGQTYRASGRTEPLMDELALHPYPNPARKGSPPDVGYANVDDFGIPQLDRVKQAVYDAFAGTGQPTTLDGLTFRLDEVGWQTDTSAYPQYSGVENAPVVVSEQTQANDIATMVQRYFACDPTVTAVELFLLVDEKYRNGRDETGAVVGGGWQSGLLTAGGEGVSTPKTAYAQDAPLFAAGRGACTTGMASWTPGASTVSRQTSQHPGKHPKKKAKKRRKP
jgi:hypothetical protein